MSAIILKQFHYYSLVHIAIYQRILTYIRELADYYVRKAKVTVFFMVCKVEFAKILQTLFSPGTIQDVFA